MYALVPWLQGYLHVHPDDCAPSLAGQDDQVREPSALPDPPESALPRLGVLSSAAPSPLLQWQLAEILYAYCTAMHLYQGEWASDAVVGACFLLSSASRVIVLACGVMHG